MNSGKLENITVKRNDLFKYLEFLKNKKIELGSDKYKIWSVSESFIADCLSTKNLPIYAKTPEIGAKKASERNKKYKLLFEKLLKMVKNDVKKIRELLVEKELLVEFNKLYNCYKEGKSLVPAFVVITDDKKD